MQVHQGRSWEMHETQGVILSQLNGSLTNFKAAHSKVMRGWYKSFDRVTAKRKGHLAISDVVQGRLYTICRTDEEVQALMIYLVEKCEVPLALVRKEIKAPFRRLGFDLCRIQRLVSA